MPELTFEQAYMADLTELETLDARVWIAAEPEDMTPAHPNDLHPVTLSEVSALVVNADELEPHART